MKKIITFSVLFLIMVMNVCASELIPSEIRVNDSVYLIFQWTAPENVENFSTNILSDDKIVFDSYKYNLSSIKKGESIFKVFKGTATEVGNYQIQLLKRHFQNGQLIGSVEIFEISVVPDAGVRIIEKIVIQNVTSKEIQKEVNSVEIQNETIIEILKNETSDPLNNLIDKNSTEVLEKTAKKPLIRHGSIYYILGGLILGIVFGAVIAYAKD
ncbi:conserved hypothetical protein [Methanococcus vannielii SB]|jgi:hypothetical protein|uniref:Uncharacterized protein n=1 Tax=Methanococcus vannielii (strain ATCC 35089 / DSM 1224 / JCM 13029 / OCM 148 / SB) TaxID=406327 RepID=A6US84_METVS|nr:hypothetical protein [Methanococcus vannielii]ABR55356.1 conserved hypothetical protein [Methanococcus vannielii SB]